MDFASAFEPHSVYSSCSRMDEGFDVSGLDGGFPVSDAVYATAIQAQGVGDLSVRPPDGFNQWAQPGDDHRNQSSFSSEESWDGQDHRLDDLFPLVEDPTALAVFDDTEEGSSDWLSSSAPAQGTGQTMGGATGWASPSDAEFGMSFDSSPPGQQDYFNAVTEQAAFGNIARFETPLFGAPFVADPLNATPFGNASLDTAPFEADTMHTPVEDTSFQATHPKTTAVEMAPLPATTIDVAPVQTDPIPAQEQPNGQHVEINSSSVLLESGDVAQANYTTNTPSELTSAMAEIARLKAELTPKSSQQDKASSQPQLLSPPTTNNKRPAALEFEKPATKKTKAFPPAAQPLADEVGPIESMWSPTRGSFKQSVVSPVQQNPAYQAILGNSLKQGGPHTSKLSKAATSKATESAPKATTRKAKQPRKPKPTNAAPHTPPSSALAEKPTKKPTKPAKASQGRKKQLPIPTLPQPPYNGFASAVQAPEEDVPVPSIEVEEDPFSNMLRTKLTEAIHGPAVTASSAAPQIEVDPAFTPNFGSTEILTQSINAGAYQTQDAFHPPNFDSAPSHQTEHASSSLHINHDGTMANANSAAKRTATDLATTPTQAVQSANNLTTMADEPALPTGTNEGSNHPNSNPHVNPPDTYMDGDHPTSAIAMITKETPEHGIIKYGGPYKTTIPTHERPIEVLMKEPFGKLNKTEASRIVLAIYWGYDPREFWQFFYWNPRQISRVDILWPAIEYKRKRDAQKAAEKEVAQQAAAAQQAHEEAKKAREVEKRKSREAVLAELAKHESQKKQQAQVAAMHVRRDEAMHTQAAAMRAQATKLQHMAAKMQADAARLQAEAAKLDFHHAGHAQHTQHTGQFGVGHDGAMQLDETPEQMGARRQREAVQKAQREDARRMREQQMHTTQLKRK